MKLLCSACLHELDEAGWCTHASCDRSRDYGRTGYTVPAPKLSEAPDPFPMLCPACGQAIPRNRGE